MLEVPNRVRVLIIVVAIGVLVGLSALIAVSVKSSLYDIEEITEGIIPTEVSTEGDPTFPSSAASDAVVNDLYNMEQGNIPDSEYAVLRALVVLDSSPMCKDVAQANYEVKLINEEWFVKFNCDGYDLVVTCDGIVFSPYMYTCSREFTEEEVAYFSSLGKAWEVENEDGTFSIYFS